ncbi:cell division protein FtsQ/DivIB [Urbifossiella limnaea]|uniref:Cell division protein FtsQ n=1 Tax=Urbifossiella limnaea TaxID=2528023 RepID=A0A517XT65_9BACT|nr:hypothetical protein [Urbifossiella limnaea]QDU20685.1 Cell division protein FtsQ [Urbifossiella limnaea]
MPRRKPPAPPQRRWRAGLAVLITLAVAAAVLVTLNVIGGDALRRIGGRDRYRVPFADITCDSPPGLDRATFLAEVRYAGELPETVSALDAADRDRLAAGFARHPWVESVEAVTAVPGGVRAALRFRTPVLAVTTTAGEPRLLDANGVLLPVTPTPPGLAELVGRVLPPRVPAGEMWDDAEVRQALDLRLSYGASRVERVAAGWKLTLADGRLLLVGR